MGFWTMRNGALPITMKDMEVGPPDQKYQNQIPHLVQGQQLSNQRARGARNCAMGKEMKRVYSMEDGIPIPTSKMR
jgi:hypothetical protein